VEDCGFLLARVSIGSSEPKKAQPGAEAWREASLRRLWEHKWGRTVQAMIRQHGGATLASRWGPKVALAVGGRTL